MVAEEFWVQSSYKQHILITMIKFASEIKNTVLNVTISRHDITRDFATLPSGHLTLEQGRNLVGLRLFRCSKLNFNVVPTSSAR